MTSDEKDREIAKLREALKWFISEGAQYEKDFNKFYDGGCGCCATDIMPPVTIYETIMKVSREQPQ